MKENSALRSRNYVTYLVGNTISLHGLWMYRVALGWFAWQLSESEFWIGVIAFTQFAPAVIFGPVFGVLADRFDRRAASLLINSLSLINMLLLGFLTSNGSVDIHVLTLFALMQGMLDGAHMPVRMTIVPNLVQKPQLQSAIALTSVSFNVSRAIGPAIAGVVIARWDVATAFFVNGISYLSLIWAIIVVRLNPSEETQTERKAVWSELKEGAHYAFTHKSIRALLVIVALASVFGRGALEMMPAFADSVFAGGSSALATLTTAIGVGAIVAGLILSRGTKWLTINVVRFAVLVGGLLIAYFSTLTDLNLAVLVIATSGVVLSMVGVGSQILIQTLVDDKVRGRVSSFWGMIAFGGTALGGLIVGAAANAFSLERAGVTTGLLCAAAALVSIAIDRRNS